MSATRSRSNADAGPVDALLANPLAFMAQNIVVPGIDGTGKDHMDPNAPMEMALVTKPADKHAAARLGQPLGLYFLIPASYVATMVSSGAVQVGRKFNTYFCSYERGATFGAMLGSKANLMFTATMDGCTFAVGSAGPNGSRLVYHANSGGDAAKQANQIAAKLGTNIAGSLSPSDYRSDLGQSVMSSTTFGVRDGASWSFYSQIYYDDRGVTNYGTPKLPRKYFLKEVKRFL